MKTSRTFPLLNYFIGWFLFTLSSGKLLAQAQAPLQIHRLTGDFYVYTSFGVYQNEPVPANGLYLVTKAGAVIFDSPWDTTQFQPLLDSIFIRHGVKAVLCIATHFHDDRTAGLSYFRSKGIATYTTRRTDQLSAERGKPRAEFLVDQDTVFQLGGYRFELFYPGEGHSPDNIVVWFPKEKILYGGCFVKSTEAATLGNLSDANTKAWPVSVKNIFSQLGTPIFVIPGHQSWASNQSLQHTLDLLLEYNQKAGHQ